MKIYLFIIMLLTGFPYIQFIPNSLYTQPYVFLIVLPLTFIAYQTVHNKIPMHVHLSSLGLLVCAALGTILSYKTIGVQEVKSLVNYVAPALLIPVYMYFFYNYAKLSRSLFVFISCVWLITGFVQLYVHAGFLTFLMGNYSNVAEVVIASGRGAPSLAPEPTHYGIILLLLSCICYFLGAGKLLVLLLLGAVFFIAISTTASALLFLAIFTAVVYKGRVFHLVTICLMLIPVTYLISSINPSGIRLLELLALTLESPSTIFKDASAAARLGGLYAGLDLASQNFFLPNGYSSTHWINQVSNAGYSFPVSEAGMPSGWGIIIYQSGFIGIIFIAIMYAPFLYFYRRNNGGFFVILSFLAFIGQFMIGIPLFSATIASMIVHKKNSKKLNEERRKIA